jgi:DHA1 family multidrug resistance protein-like MFS transporter
MEHIVRSSYAGKFLRAVTGKKILKYPEERDDFQLPACYADSPALEAPLQSRVDTAPDEELMGRRNSSQASEPNPLPKITTRSELERVHTQLDIERLYTAAAQREELKHTPSRPIAPTKSSDGTILVDWYSTDDPENPRNWSSGKKIFVASLIK